MIFKWIKEYHLLQGFLFSLLLCQFAIGMKIQQSHDVDLNNLIGSQVFLFLMSFFIWISNHFFIKNKKLFLQGFHIVFGLIISILLSILFYYISPFEDSPLLPLKPLSIQSAFPNLAIRGLIIYMVMYPVQYYLFRDKKVKTEMLSIEQEKQEALHLRLAFLGKQLDPHFLFNSLSVLRAGTKDQWVKNYVNKLTQVYRYTLQKDHVEGLSLVVDEIEFVQSYLSLFQERFEEALDVQIDIPNLDKDVLLPRLALQLLVENALKHNEFTLRNPLKLEIYTEGNDTLVVRNNVQQLAQSDYKKEPSGIGLKNLRQRYKLLKQQEIEILIDAKHYTVKIPMIRK